MSCSKSQICKFLVVLCVTAMPALGQDKDPQATMASFYEQASQDGATEPAEKLFDELDKTADGVLKEEDFEGNAAWQTWTMQGDSNNDGAVTRGEFARHILLETNSPRTTLTWLARETNAGQGTNPIKDLFASLDLTEDDQLTVDDFPSGSAWYTWAMKADVNEDGSVGLGELQAFSVQEISKILDPETDPLSFGWVAAYAVTALLFVLIVLFAYNTQAGVIARATTKEAIRQPVFLLLIGVGIIFLLLNTFLPFFTFGDDVKMLIDCGLATILIIGSLMAVWTASTSISSEIEGKTAMTLLSKPINRRQFIVGKYIGILQAVFWMLLPVIAVFLLLILYKIGYDAKEAAKDVPALQERIPVMVKTLPGLALILLEISVLAAVSVAISTRLPMVVNIVTTFAIFIVGHLTPVLVKAGTISNEFVEFMARLIATILPSLEVFNMEAAVATGTIVPPEYLGWALVYCMAYCMAAILLAFLLFEDRDLA